MTTRQRAFCPVWAEKIEVKKEGSVLLVRGWGQLLLHVDERQGVDPGDAKKLNLLEQFRKYRLQQLSEEPEGTDGGIYQFADADDDEKLFAFVRAFGPVWGDIREVETDALFHVNTLTVAQDMAVLRLEQKRFKAATQLLMEVNRKGLAADLEAIVAALMTIAPAPGFYSPDPSLLPAKIAALIAPNRGGDAVGAGQLWTWSMFAADALVNEKAKERQRQLILQYAHHGMCSLLNRCKPDLFPVDGRQPIELPSIERKGIRDALYYRLRLDYLAQRQIGICENCGGHFEIRKRGARACKESCRRALRNLNYWSKKNKTINRKRKQKRKTAPQPKKGR